MKKKDSSPHSSPSHIGTGSPSTHMEEMSEWLRTQGYKVTKEYSDVGLSKVITEPPLGKTLFGRTWWDWLQLIAALAIPLILGVATYLFNTQQADLAQRLRDDDRSKVLDQQREAALQSYLDHMSDLLLGNNTGKDSPSLASAKPTKEIILVANERTATILRDLDGRRKGVVLEFLYGADLIGIERGAPAIYIPPVITLWGDDLSGVDVSGGGLAGATLAGANLSSAKLSGMELPRVNFTGANLTGANLTEANLPDANFSGADLSGADLTETNLASANFSDADLSGADLTGTTNLASANFRGAKLQGTTMAHGAKHQ